MGARISRARENVPSAERGPSSTTRLACASFVSEKRMNDRQCDDVTWNSSGGSIAPLVVCECGGAVGVVTEPEELQGLKVCLGCKKVQP